MKDGLYYRDKRTGEVLLCHTFSRSYHVFINRNNVEITRGKYNVYEVVRSKKIIAEFEASRAKYPIKKNVREPHIFGGWNKVLEFNTIYENELSEVTEFMDDLSSKLQHVGRIGNKTEHHLRNSIEMELLMQLEDGGLGHWTISQLLNHLQDMYSNGQTESFYVLEDRKKRL